MSETSRRAEKRRLLVVDDDIYNLQFLRTVLSLEYAVATAGSGADALAVVNSDNPPDLILLDLKMPEMDGFQVLERIKGHDLDAIRDIPVIILTASSRVGHESNGLALGAADFIHKPVIPAVLSARINAHLTLRDYRRTLEQRVLERTAEIDTTRLEIIRCLGRAAEYRDDQTGIHILRMTRYAALLAEAAGLRGADAELVVQATPMHDVGKIGIPDSILRKPGLLTEDEREIMQQHTIIGAQIIGHHPSALMRTARMLALTHHERWDGSGYGEGLRGEAIPFEGRLVAIVDVFDALTSARPYKKIWPTEKAVAYVREHRGTQFDPHLVDIFVDVLPGILDVMREYVEIRRRASATPAPTEAPAGSPGGD